MMPNRAKHLIFHECQKIHCIHKQTEDNDIMAATPKLLGGVTFFSTSQIFFS